MRYFIRLAYRGAPFHGWQIQPNAISVQESLETALSTILRSPISITGAGRTDTGVNATEMYAHFDCDTMIPDKKKFLLSLNRLVGKDISIYDIIDVRPEAHARFDAISRTYKYFITESKNPFIYPFSWYSPSSLDYDIMNRAADILLGTKDFTSFSKLHTDVKTNICNVTQAEWTKETKDIMVFTISADRFLRNMVRAIVGTLVNVGRGKLDIDGFRKVIDKKDRCAAGSSMPGEALFLWKIEYPREIFIV